MEPGESSYREERSRLPVAFVAGLLIMAVVFGAIFFLTRKLQPRGGTSVEVKLPFGAAEQAYADRIHFTDMHMAKASNFLNQEFTYVAGTMTNDGTRDIKAMDVSIEFRDPFKQVILRDTEHLIGPDTPKLAAGQNGTFQVSVEHLPPEWSHEYPIIRVTGLVLE
ncbi:MAG TPA: hypothetical protein VGD60_09805 [Candidatus Acidoferrales bacterium]